jgi:hypothetical protein
MTAVSPKRTHAYRHELAIANLRHAGRELTHCGTKCEFAAHAPMSAFKDQNADFAVSYFGLTARLKKNLI